MALFLGVETEIKWMDDISSTPIIGQIFLFVLVFVPAVIVSLIFQSIIPTLHDDIGFTKAMLVLLPLGNLVLWIVKIRPFILFVQRG